MGNGWMMKRSPVDESTIHHVRYFEGDHVTAPLACFFRENFAAYPIENLALTEETEDHTGFFASDERLMNV